MDCNQYRDKANRLTFCNSKVSLFLFLWKKRKILKNFSLSPTSDIINSPDIKSQLYRGPNNEKIRIEWDNWEGMCVIAESKESEGLLLEILEYLC